MFINKVNKYLLSEFIRSYLFVLISLSLLLWISQATRLLSLVTENGNSVSTYIVYISLLFPKIVSKVAVISFIISSFISIIKLKTNNEFNIYLLSGVSKINICNAIIAISLIPTIFAFFLNLYLAPISSYKSRVILSNSKFTMINSLVKEKNFNSPLDNLTIYVDDNDNFGNLRKIFIYEENRTIIAKFGKVLKNQNENYLQLFDGQTHEKSKSGEISVINFDKTLFDLSNKASPNIKTPKFSEQSTLWLFKQFQKKNLKKFEINNLLEEIHGRIFKPLFILIFSIITCFLLYSNDDKIKKEKLRFSIFIILIVSLIFLEVLISLSVLNKYTITSFYIFPIVLFLILYFSLSQFLKNESN